MVQLTGVVRQLLIINILVFLACQFMPNIAEYLVVYDIHDTQHFLPYQIITYMFMHANIGHIFFNMFGLVIFGPPLEMIFGERKFLIYYFFTGIGAWVLQAAISFFTQTDTGPMLGASGAIFGLLAGYGFMFPNSVISLLFPPISLKAKYFVVIYAAIELFQGVSTLNGVGIDNVAHFAHLGGALFGVILLFIWRYIKL